VRQKGEMIGKLRGENLEGGGAEESAG